MFGTPGEIETEAENPTKNENPEKNRISLPASDQQLVCTGIHTKVLSLGDQGMVGPPQTNLQVPTHTFLDYRVFSI